MRRSFNEEPHAIEAYTPPTREERRAQRRRQENEREERRRELVRPDWARRAKNKFKRAEVDETRGNKKIDLVNNLFFYFVLTQIGFFITPRFAAPPLEITFDITPALWVHAFSLLAFAGGYGLNALMYGMMHKTPRKRRTATAQSDARSAAKGNPRSRWSRGRAAESADVVGERLILSDAFFKAAYVLLIVGTFIVILQVAVFQNPLEYLRKLFTGNFDSTIRDAFLAPSEVSGISGVLKMFGSVPLSAYLFSMSLGHFVPMSQRDQQRMKRLNSWAFWMTVVKVLFSLDRLTLMAVVIANVFVSLRTRKNLGPKVFAVLLFLVLVDFVSQKRVAGQGASGFIVLYYNLGIVNLQRLLDTLQGNTYGFSLLLAPLTFVLKLVGLSDIVPSSDYQFMYAGAQYLVGYAYQDYGALFWWLFAFMGHLYKTLDRKALQQRSVPYVSVYLLALSATITFVAVPSLRSVDFWLSVLIPLVLLRFFARRVPISLNQTEDGPRQNDSVSQRRVRVRQRQKLSSSRLSGAAVHPVEAFRS